ncbi:MAG TPA: hypothetical protein VF113_01670 [Stellaceae bacterium]
MALTARPSSSASRRQAERLDEARDALSKPIAVGHGSFNMYVRTRVPWHRAADHRHMLEGPRKAGWREQETRPERFG